MTAAQDSTDQDFSLASNPFNQYHSMIQKISSLQLKKEDAKIQAEKLEQVYTLLSLQHANSPQLEMFKNSAIYLSAWR